MPHEANVLDFRTPDNYLGGNSSKVDNNDILRIFLILKELIVRKNVRVTEKRRQPPPVPPRGCYTCYFCTFFSCGSHGPDGGDFRRAGATFVVVVSDGYGGRVEVSLRSDVVSGEGRVGTMSTE
jgi:hypothetical protein